MDLFLLCFFLGGGGLFSTLMEQLTEDALFCLYTRSSANQSTLLVVWTPFFFKIIINTLFWLLFFPSPPWFHSKMLVFSLEHVLVICVMRYQDLDPMIINLHTPDWKYTCSQCFYQKGTVEPLLKEHPENKQQFSLKRGMVSAEGFIHMEIWKDQFQKSEVKESLNWLKEGRSFIGCSSVPHCLNATNKSWAFFCC